MFSENLYEPSLFEYDEIIEEKRQIIRRLKERSSRLSKIFTKVDKTLDEISQRNILYKLAFVEAAKAVSKEIAPITLNVIKDACLESVEYNFEPFYNRLQFAVLTHLDDIIEISLDSFSQNILVNIRFSVLGDPDEWLQAAKDVAVDLGFGKIEDPAIASHIWAEKIYGVDREGKTVERFSDKGNSWDVTDNFVGKYTLTIESRLLKIPMDKAPFWYFLEYGNVESSGSDGGTPYPMIPYTHPTRLTGRLRERIKFLFNKTFDLYKRKADKYLANLVTSGFARSISEAEPELNTIRDVNRYYEEVSSSLVDDLEYGTDVFDMDEIPIQKEISEIEVEYIQFTRRGKLVTVAVNAKTRRFVKSKGFS